MKQLTSISRTCTLALAVLCAGEAAAQHKTGLEFQFDLRYTQNQEDSKVEGDKSSLEFAQRRARWWMSGNQDAFKYKFRFKFKNGSVDLSYVKVGYKLGPKTTLTLGRGYDPVDTGTTTYNFRMSDQVIYSGLPIDKGDVGIQLEHKPAGGKLIVGLANGRQTSWADGVDGSTQLNSFIYGFDYKVTSGVFRPRIGASMHHIPAEKVIATGNKYHGRNDVTLILGTSLVMGDTAVHFSAAQHTKSKAEQSLAGGPKAVVSEEYQGRAYEIRIAQKFSSAFDGSFHLIQNEYRKGDKKNGEETRASAQLFMYPYKHKKAYFTLSLIHDTKKPEGGKRSSKNSVFLTASARPSYVIAE